MVSISTKTVFFTIFFTIPLAPMSEKRYNIPTQNENITCTLTTITEQQMLGLITYTQASSEANDKLMVFTISISNNTPNKIYLANRKYLYGIENFHCPIKVSIYKLYPKLKKLPLPIMITTYASLGLFLLSSLMCLYINTKVFLLKQNNTSLTTFTVLAAITGTLFILYLNEFEKKETFLTNKKKAILLQSIFCNYINQNCILAINEPPYTILPHSKFHDLFFVDLNDASRDIFDTNLPTLQYEIGSPQDS